MIVRLENLDDPRLYPYRNLRDRDLANEGGLFIAEGELIVRRLLESGLETVSILASEQRLSRIAADVPEEIPLYALPPEMMNQIIGFKFHSGVMGVGRRPTAPSLSQVVPQTGPCRLMICPETANTENLGVMARIAAAFSVNAMILGENCCDPYYRQSVRVSMGNVLQLPIVRSDDLATDLRRLGGEMDVQRFATVLDRDAQALPDVHPPARAALMFGNEAQGLSDKWLGFADHRVTIPMPPNVDSLNVAIAAGICLYHFAHAGSSRPTRADAPEV